MQADSGEVDAYLLGNWRAPFGISLVLDRLSALMLVLAAGVALVALIYARGGDDQRSPHFHALFQFQLMGLNGAFLTADLFNLFVFFEVMLISSYGLLLHGARCGAAEGVAALRRIQPCRRGAVPDRREPVVRPDRHTEHGGHGAAHGTPAARPNAAAAKRGAAAAGGVLRQGSAAAAVLLAAGHLRRGMCLGSGAVRCSDQGGCVQRAAHDHTALWRVRRTACRVGRVLAARAGDGHCRRGSDRRARGVEVAHADRLPGGRIRRDIDGCRRPGPGGDRCRGSVLSGQQHAGDGGPVPAGRPDRLCARQLG